MSVCVYMWIYVQGEAKIALHLWVPETVYSCIINYCIIFIWTIVNLLLPHLNMFIIQCVHTCILTNVHMYIHAYTHVCPCSESYSLCLFSFITSLGHFILATLSIHTLPSLLTYYLFTHIFQSFSLLLFNLVIFSNPISLTKVLTFLVPCLNFFKCTFVHFYITINSFETLAHWCNIIVI